MALEVVSNHWSPTAGVDGADVPTDNLATSVRAAPEIAGKAPVIEDAAIPNASMSALVWL